MLTLPATNILCRRSSRTELSPNKHNFVLPATNVTITTKQAVTVEITVSKTSSDRLSLHPAEGSKVLFRLLSLIGALRLKFKNLLGRTIGKKLEPSRIRTGCFLFNQCV